LGNFSPKLLFIAVFLHRSANFRDPNGNFAHFGRDFSQFWQKTRQ